MKRMLRLFLIVVNLVWFYCLLSSAQVVGSRISNLAVLRIQDNRSYHDGVASIPDDARQFHKPRLSSFGTADASGGNSVRHREASMSPGQAGTSVLTSTPGLTSCDSLSMVWDFNYASETIPSRDAPNAMETDDLGNVYVTGSGYRWGTATDFITVKYDSNGKQVWSEFYDGPYHLSDEPFAIAVDDAGNVYVAGMSCDRSGGACMTTVKYANTGMQEWVATYDGSGSGADCATAMAIDHDGNLYVTGYSTGAGTGYDVVTIKYNQAGVECWVRRHNGPASMGDGASAIAMGDSGKIYVTGSVAAPGYSSYYATIKYDSSGAEEWAVILTGLFGARDNARDIAVDNSGNVYVTGHSRGSGNTDDYTTVKYNSSGNEVWVRRYNGPDSSYDEAVALALDDSGNVYVTGNSRGTSTDIATIKYSPSGIERWVARYDGPDTLDDAGVDIAVDAGGNIYVTGDSYSIDHGCDIVTLAYDALGAQRWIARMNGESGWGESAAGAVLRRGGGVVVSGVGADSETGKDFATMAYGADGNEQWIALYDGLPSSDDHLGVLAVDKVGNIVLGGYRGGSAAAVVCCDPSGSLKWVYNSPESGGIDYVKGIQVDDSGNVYVTGPGYATGSGDDFVTEKISPVGAQIWIARYDGTLHLTDSPVAIVVDKQGGVYVSGCAWEADSILYYTTIKYSPDGMGLWIRQKNWSGGKANLPADMALDKDGNVYVTGECKGPSFTMDYGTVAYSSSGTELWSAVYSGPDHEDDGGTAIAVDSMRNVCVTGVSWSDSGSFDYLTVKYDSSGVEQWTARYNGPADSYDAPCGIALDANGNVIVTGSSEGLGTRSDYATIKYDMSGKELWASRFDWYGNLPNDAVALGIDHSGGIYVTGSGYGGSTTQDFITVLYDPNGNAQWIAEYDGSFHSYDAAAALAISPDGNAVVAGATSFAGGYQSTILMYHADNYQAYPYRERWNLVSLPRQVANPSLHVVFRDASSALFEYGDGYASRESLRTGTGYWLKFLETMCVQIDGDSVTSDTIAVVEGWNLIGSISRPVNIANITSIPPAIVTSTLYGFNGTYFSTNTIEPGKGYWIHASQPAQLILSATPPPVPDLMASRINIVSTNLTPPPPPGDTPDETSGSIPREFCLYQNFPNPFNPTTEIRFDLPEATDVRLTIVNILGQEVTELAEGYHAAGSHRRSWDASEYPSGVYFCRIAAGKHSDMKKLLLIR